MIQNKTINSKEVFITEKHHHNLIPWAQYRNNNNRAPLVFIFDHHMDNNEPFMSYAYDKENMKHDKKKVQIELKKIDINKIDTIKDSISKLKNDEYIQTALKINLVDKVIIISYDSFNDTPRSFEEKKYQNSFSQANNFIPPYPAPVRPFTYPDSNIYIPENRCAVGCTRGPHNDDCVIPHYNQCIESVLLDDKLKIIEDMNSTLITNGKLNEKYILDFDLDYFHTKQSINPNDPKTFYSLIQDAEIITITKEEDWIKEWVKQYGYDPNLSVNYLIKRLLFHIDIATK